MHFFLLSMHLLPQVTLDQREVKAPNTELAEEEDGKTRLDFTRQSFHEICWLWVKNTKLYLHYYLTKCFQRAEALMLLKEKQSLHSVYCTYLFLYLKERAFQKSISSSFEENFGIISISMAKKSTQEGIGKQAWFQWDKDNPTKDERLTDEV